MIESTVGKQIFLGKSPLDNVSLPQGFLRIRIIKEGYTSVENFLLRNLVNDVNRAVDYVETRKDLDNKKIAYLGHSWGARIGSIILAVEDRYDLGLLSFGGFSTNPALPEATELNFAPHVTAPILMINGEHDVVFPYSMSVQPMFDTFGTLEEDKTLILLNGGHGIYATQRNTYMKHMLSWLDRYFGSVKFLSPQFYWMERIQGCQKYSQ